MKNRILLMSLLAFLTFSCSENMLEEDLNTKKSKSEVSTLSVKQAEMYASLFSSYLDEKDTPPNSDSKTRSNTKESKVLAGIDYYIENEDTLLYAFNYKNNNGYIIIAADNSTFPILAHSNQGNLNFKGIDKDSPLNMFIAAYKKRVKDSSTNIDNLEYYQNWKDLGNKDYEYEIILNNDEPIAETRGRRENSSGKASIYPYTGKELDTWCQKGGYNYYAPNKACIGCPAIATGMLMYDTSQRMLGNSASTYPSFSYFYDAYDITSNTNGTETASKLKQIADSIPNYNWGSYKDAGSGASPANIETGLRKLGYKNAKLTPYNFETLYNNLSFKGYNYFGEETTFNRGVLIGAYTPYGEGHIWFCDGYYEQSYTCKKKFLGITMKTWTEYDDRIYMNWGWGVNQGNGWYCATDDTWTSLEGNSSVNLKVQPVIYTNLSYYEYPRNY